MKLEELERRRKQLKAETDIVFKNMDTIIEEGRRVTSVAHNSSDILDKLDTEFQQQTGLNKQDVSFLFVATALQCARIYLMNHFTSIEAAGKNNKIEKELHRVQNKTFDHFDRFKSNMDSDKSIAREYYAPLNQIISSYNVPYDTQRFLDEKYDLFKGGNHRYSTLGHDPILGLVFGTANILTNSITTTKAPIVKSHHVVYTQNIVKGDNVYKTPQIGLPCSTSLVLYNASRRVQDDLPAVVAAIIKQILHIGTDMFTPCGIHLPGANLILSTSNIEKLSKYITTGDLLKAGASAGIATLINTIISSVHLLLYDDKMYSNLDVYSVKTKKIIMYSNAIATSSNVLWVGTKVASGNALALKQLDLGGLIITINRLINDRKTIQKIKEEFVFGSFDKMIEGEPLKLIPHE